MKCVILADTVENSSSPTLTQPSFVDLTEFIDLTDLDGQELSRGCHASKELSDTARQWEKHSIQHISDSLRSDHSKYSAAAWIISSTFQGSGRWLHLRGGYERPFHQSNSEFDDSLRLRLLLSPLENFITIGVQVACGCGANIQSEPLNLLDCIHYLRLENQIRDDGISNELWSFI
jgi:hypothetical protein